ncbi:hypothetical protein Q7O_004035 [Pectobacterium carotovorum subsp. carotovorum PCCS1]|nr:hypothetical protein [Pectobacterium carotovorum subsp. carotovorum PCCS1]
MFPHKGQPAAATARLLVCILFNYFLQKIRSNTSDTDISILE